MKRGSNIWNRFTSGRKALLLIAFVAFLFPSNPASSEYGDVVLNRQAEKQGMRPVIFSHWFHRIRFRCKVCHTELGFKMRAGANEITMATIIRGEYCGACHNGKIAWPVQQCGLCHSGRPGLESGIIGGHQTGGPGIW